MSENTKKIYDHKINSISGDELNLSKFEGKILLLVNVASKCGFSKQYNDLQNLYEKYSEKGFIVLSLSSSINTISPFSTSLKYLAPIISRAHVSEAKTKEFFNFPITNGLIPKGSLTPINFF